MILKIRSKIAKQIYPPHIYTISGLSFNQLFENKTKQSIVISGESGAGVYIFIYINYNHIY